MNGIREEIARLSIQLAICQGVLSMLGQCTGKNLLINYIPDNGTGTQRTAFKQSLHKMHNMDASLSMSKPNI